METSAEVNFNAGAVRQDLWIELPLDFMNHQRS